MNGSHHSEYEYCFFQKIAELGRVSGDRGQELRFYTSAFRNVGLHTEDEITKPTPVIVI